MFNGVSNLCFDVIMAVWYQLLSRPSSKATEVYREKDRKKRKRMKRKRKGKRHAATKKNGKLKGRVCTLW